MSWWRYVTQTSGTESPKAMQAQTGIDGPNFSRWKSGHVPKAEMAAQFARAYGRPVLEAFVAAEFLTAVEAKARPATAPDLTQLTNDQLLELVRSRMIGEDGEDHVSATTKKADDASAKPQQDDYGLASRRGRRQRTDEPGDGA